MMVRNRGSLGFGLRQFRSIAGLHSIRERSHVFFVVSNGECNRLWLAKLRSVTSLVAVPATHNVAWVHSEVQVRPLRGCQLRAIAALPSSLAGIEILRRISRLPRCQDRQQGQAANLCPHTFP